MKNANYRKLNDRSISSSTYHKKDGTNVRSILKQELCDELHDLAIENEMIALHGPSASRQAARACVYENTSENAREIGWVHFPEYCFGDKTLPYVIHDHRKGTFTYSASADVCN